MLHLAIHYENGFGVQKDSAAALQWYQKVLNHTTPGEESIKVALMALSRK